MRALGAALVLTVLAGVFFALPALAADDDGEEPALPNLDVNATDFPASSIVDFAFLRDHPTGVHGDVFVGTDGHFYFEDGVRARFWGINIAKTSVFVPKPQIDQAIAAIARAGFNLVRFHHLDDLEGLLPADRAGTPERLDPAKLALLDYWIAQLGKLGIYVYLDLLDYRTFQESEDVPNAAALGRGAKPYAFLDHRLISLQQQYARKFLIDHVNPYTGLSYAADPTVALLELCDENGLFNRSKAWTEMVAPYRDDLQRRWNEWLRERYGDDKTLGEAWTDADGNAGLLGGESLAQGTIRLFPPPVRPANFPAATAGVIDPENGQVGRVSDRRQFFAEIHRQYFRAMRDYLRSHGVRQPLTAVTDFLHLTDLRTVSEQLDFVGMNFYYDHPLWAPGNEWHLPGYFENVNPVADPRVESFVPRVCASRVYGKPLVVREWNYCWPNKFRACGMAEAATYAALQDLDAMILFTYDVRPGQRKLEFFDVRSDPARWGLAGVCASLYLRRQVAPARRRVAVAYSTVDTHFPTYQPYPTLIYQLGWVSQLSNLFFDQELEKQPDLVLASGRCSGGGYPGQRTVICGNWPAGDLLDHRRDRTADVLSGYDVATVPEKTQEFSFGGTMFPPGAKERLTASPGYLLADVQHHEDYRPIGVGADGEACLGFRDMKRRNYVFRKLAAAHEMRVALDALNQLFDDEVSNAFLDTQRFSSDTGQVRRLVDAELLLVDAPQAQVIAGALQNAALTRTKQMSVSSESPMGVVVWVSLDGKPVGTSQRWSLKFVSTATNRGEIKNLHQNNRERTTYALTELGTSPVSTLGEVSATPTIVSLADKALVKTTLRNGTWELMCEGQSYYLYCDTPGVRFEFPQMRASVNVTAYQSDESSAANRTDQPVSYPSGIRLLQIAN